MAALQRMSDRLEQGIDDYFSVLAHQFALMGNQESPEGTPIRAQPFFPACVRGSGQDARSSRLGGVVSHYFRQKKGISPLYA